LIDDCRLAIGDWRWVIADFGLPIEETVWQPLPRTINNHQSQITNRK
jgi:hypothetical protein